MKYDLAYWDKSCSRVVTNDASLAINVAREVVSTLNKMIQRNVTSCAHSSV